MSKPTVFTNTTTAVTPRARRGVAGVIAQYIQDLSQPSGPRPDTHAAAA